MKHGIKCWGVKGKICSLGAEVAGENVMGSEDGQWREKVEEDMSSGKSLRAKAWRPDAPSEHGGQGENLAWYSN